MAITKIHRNALYEIGMKIKAKLLLLDNQDSFTYNIVDLLRAFVQIETHVVDSNSFEVSTLDEYQYVIISPGPGKPNDFPVIPKVIAYCETNRIPLLGICLGHQAICEFFGAQLFRLKNVLHGQQHWIEIEPQSDLFLDVPNRIKVGLYHSWAIYKDSLPKELKRGSRWQDETGLPHCKLKGWRLCSRWNTG